MQEGLKKGTEMIKLRRGRGEKKGARKWGKMTTEKENKVIQKIFLKSLRFKKKRFSHVCLNVT